ncbi:MAG TPA: type II toxin-antitoxin system RelE/ParE family toxin [Burkholderiales bacterium]|nr:type II toxin-antitoxin system RelE/ParE family toxin [Burkholderiales bacterium]
MAEYRLLIKPSALKELNAVDSKRDRQRIINRIQALAGDPRPPKFDKMAGAASLFRVRQGQYRIVYAIDDTARTVDVIKIGHRREVYRRNA